MAPPFQLPSRQVETYERERETESSKFEMSHDYTFSQNGGHVTTLYETGGVL
jgi:hypothetical protein